MQILEEIWLQMLEEMWMQIVMQILKEIKMQIWNLIANLNDNSEYKSECKCKLCMQMLNEKHDCTWEMRI